MADHLANYGYGSLESTAKRLPINHATKFDFRPLRLPPFVVQVSILVSQSVSVSVTQGSTSRITCHVPVHRKVQG